MNPKRIKDQMRGMTVDAAITILLQKGRKNLLFYWGTQPFYPSELRKYLAPPMLLISCGELSGVQFWGGPPGQLSSFSGTLLTVICDVLLYDQAITTYEDEVIYLGQEN